MRFKCGDTRTLDTLIMMMMIKRNALGGEMSLFFIIYFRLSHGQ